MNLARTDCSLAGSLTPWRHAKKEEEEEEDSARLPSGVSSLSRATLPLRFLFLLKQETGSPGVPQPSVHAITTSSCRGRWTRGSRCVERRRSRAVLAGAAALLGFGSVKGRPDVHPLSLSERRSAPNRPPPFAQHYRGSPPPPPRIVVVSSPLLTRRAARHAKCTGASRREHC